MLTSPARVPGLGFTAPGDGSGLTVPLFDVTGEKSGSQHGECRSGSGGCKAAPWFPGRPCCGA